MKEPWNVSLLEGSTAWSEDWTLESRRVDIDASLLREIIELDAGSPSLFRTLVGMFRHDTEVHLPVLKEAASSGDSRTLSNIGDSLAFEAAQIGAPSIAAHCHAIEAASSHGDVELCVRLVETLLEHLDQFVAAVERELAVRA